MRRYLDGWAGRIALWLAFVAVHAFVVVQVWTGPLAPFNDVVGVYRSWAESGLGSGVWVGIDAPFVYPPLALVPILAAAAFGLDATAYGWGWLLLVVLLDAAAVAMLTLRGGRGPRHRGTVAAWWWLAFLLLLGPVGLARLEAVTAPLTIIAVWLLLERPAVAGALLAVGAWIKVWPGALLAAAVVALRTRLRVVLGAVAASAVVIGVWLALGAREELLGFVAGQTGRGLQVESLLAAPWLVMASLGLPGAAVVWDPSLNTFEVTGPGSSLLAAWSTPLLLMAAALVVVLGAVASRRHTTRALVPTALALVAILVVTNKVGSPQFTAWLAAPVVLAILAASRPSRAVVPVLLALSLAALTQLVYPTGYDLLLAAHPLLVLVLLVKHLLWVVLAGWAVVRLWRLAVSR